MTNLKIVGSVAAAFLFSLVSAGPGLARPGVAGSPTYRIDGGEIVLESPFDLEIGSVEYAKAFGDTKALLGQDKTQYFIGKVGDLAIDVSYAKPLYEKRDDGFKLVRRGAVVVNVIQSPIITKGKVKR